MLVISGEMRDFFRLCLRLVTRPINFGAGKLIKSSDEPRTAIPDEGDLGGNGALSSMVRRLHSFAGIRWLSSMSKCVNFKIVVMLL